METFKGTQGEWQQDIGIDELESDLFSIAIFTHDTPLERIATVYGYTIEELEANAKLIANSKNLLLSLEECLRLLDGMDLGENTIPSGFREWYFNCTTNANALINNIK